MSLSENSVISSHFVVYLSLDKELLLVIQMEIMYHYIFMYLAIFNTFQIKKI